MTQLLPHLHDAYNCSVYLVLAVLEDSFRGRRVFFRLFNTATERVYYSNISVLTLSSLIARNLIKYLNLPYRLFHLNLIYLDPEVFISEVAGEHKLITRRHILALRQIQTRVRFQH